MPPAGLLSPGGRAEVLPILSLAWHVGNQDHVSGDPIARCCAHCAGAWSIQTRPMPEGRVPEMPADAPNPPHPMHQLTTFELRDYRKLLERALQDRQIGNAPIAAYLRAKLDEVLAEQEQRAQIRSPRKTWPVHN